MEDNWTSTNAPMMIISTEEFGYFGIDPLGDTWIEASQVRSLWQGKRKIPVLRSRSPDEALEIVFISLDWLIKLHPDNTLLLAARNNLQERVEKHGFEGDE